MDDELSSQVLRAGDVLAEIVGRLVAAIDEGRELSQEQLSAVRDGILAWHRIHALVS